MSYVYTIDSAKRVVSVHFEKTLNRQTIEAYAADLRSHPHFHPDFSEIVDLSRVEELELDAKQAVNLADNVDPFSLNSRRAFVAQTSTQTNAARMHHILRGGEENIRIFPTMREAKCWIEMGD